MIQDREEVLNILNRIFVWKYNSLAAYIRDAEPYVKPGREALLEKVRTIAERDRSRADEAAIVVEHLEGIPMVEPYDWQVSELNYLSIEFLAGLLIAELKKQAAQLEKSGEIDPKLKEARDFVAAVRDEMGAQIRELESAAG